MPSPSPVSDTDTTSGWWTSWNHFVIMLPLIILGSWAIHWPLFAILAIGLEMAMFERHALTKHPHHPIISSPEWKYRYSVLQGVGFLTAFLIGLVGPNPEGPLPVLAIPLSADLTLITMLIHEIEHRGVDHRPSKSDNAMIITEATMIVALTGLIAYLITTT